MKVREKAEIKIKDTDIEKVFLDNGIIKIKLKELKKEFCIYQENLDYYIKRNNKKYFLNNSGRNLIVEFINNYEY